MSGRFLVACGLLLFLAVQCNSRAVKVVNTQDSDTEGNIDGWPEDVLDIPHEVISDGSLESPDEEVRVDIPDTVQELPPLPCSGCRQVTFENDPEWELSWFTVRGDYLVYDLRKYYSREAKLVLVELPSLETRITITLPNDGDNYHFCREPSIHEDKMVFLCASYPNYPEDLDIAIYDLVYYDIKADTKRVVYSFLFDDNETPHRYFFAIRLWDDYIAWVDCRRSMTAACYKEIALYKISTGEEFYINDGHEYSIHGMKMWGDKILYQAVDGRWESPYYNQFDLFIYDIPSGQTTRLTEDTIDQCHPDMWENRIVWTDCRNDPDAWACWDMHNSDIYTMELGGEETPIETEGSIQDYPSIYGDIIAWHDERNDISPHDTATGSRWEVFAVNIQTGEKRMMTESVGGSGASNPQVNEGKVYLHLHDENGMLNVYEFPF